MTRPVVAVVVVALALTIVGWPIWLTVASDNGDLWNVWTDHLRHMAEALALVHRGLVIYLGPYQDTVGDVGLDEVHRGLWPRTGIPYPPLGILLHLPVALLDRSGVVAAGTAHRLMVFQCGLASVAASGLALRRLAGARRVFFAAFAVPLLLGAGFSGFYDPIFVLAAIAAVETRSPLWAVFAFLFHFRGASALASISLDRSKAALVALVLAALNAAIALLALGHLGELETNNALHGSKHGWLPAVLAAPAIALLVRWKLPRVAVSVTLATLLIIADRQVAFWHVLVLLPAVFEGLRQEDRRGALVVGAWSVILSQVYLRTFVPASIVWLTIR